MARPVALPYQILLCCLIISAVLFILPLFHPREEFEPIPEFNFAHGYCARTPTIDLMRIVPFAGPSLQNPVCGENELVSDEVDAPSI